MCGKCRLLQLGYAYGGPPYPLPLRWCLCLAFVLNRTSPEQVRPFIGDRAEVPEQVPEQLREAQFFEIDTPFHL